VLKLVVGDEDVIVDGPEVEITDEDVGLEDGEEVVTAALAVEEVDVVAAAVDDTRSTN